MDENKYLLVKKAQSGDNSALEKIIKSEQNNIYTTLFYLKKDNDELYDIMQDVLIKISKKIYQLNNPEYFKTWLNKIIINTYYDYMRKTSKRIISNDSDESIKNIPDSKYNPTNNILYSELDSTIKRTIEKMPLHYRIPITLREVQGLSYNSISQITKTAVGTIKSRIARARGIIKNEIERYAKD